MSSVLRSEFPPRAERVERVRAEDWLFGEIDLLSGSTAPGVFCQSHVVGGHIGPILAVGVSAVVSGRAPLEIAPAGGEYQGRESRPLGRLARVSSPCGPGYSANRRCFESARRSLLRRAVTAASVGRGRNLTRAITPGRLPPQRDVAASGEGPCRFVSAPPVLPARPGSVVVWASHVHGAGGAGA
jgi:hypothetical protein